MAIVKAKCPNCGQIIEIEENEFNVMCKFCGVPFMPKEGIDEYNNYLAALTDNLSVDTVDVNADSITSYAELGLQALKEKNPEKCGFYADDILKRKPDSSEGLLLKAYFVSNNYSKEDGIRNYFLAYENAKKDNIKKLIIDTFKDGMVEYSSVNFDFLINEMYENHRGEFKDLFKYVICYISSGLEEVPFIENIKLPKKFIDEYLGLKDDKVCSMDEYKVYAYDDLLLFYQEDRLMKAVDVHTVDHEVEKFYNKKDEKKATYNFYVSNRIIEIKLADNNVDLESLITSYNLSINFINAGCYVATCVYGSYNTPSVWTLRRYRDEVLANCFFGRLFIKTYYAISPTLVKMFGSTGWFKNINRYILNKFVKKLKEKGFEDTPYRDVKY